MPSVTIGREREENIREMGFKKMRRKEMEFNLSPSISIRGEVHSTGIDHNLGVVIAGQTVGVRAKGGRGRQ